MASSPAASVWINEAIWSIKAPVPPAQLPFIRTSVDHGTALELAGTGRADPGSLFAAVTEAVAMIRRLRAEPAVA